MARGNFQDYREQNSTLSGLALYTRQDLELSQDGRPERLAGLGVTAGFFDLLGAQPLLGREFRREDELPNSTAVVILSHALWQRRFNGNPGIVGQAVTLSGRPFTVIGVMPPGVQHVGGDYRSMPHGETVDVWGPLEMPPQAERGSHFCNAIGRLKPGVSAGQAAADFNVIAGRLAQQFPDTNRSWRIAIQPLHEEIVGRSRTTLLVFFWRGHLRLADRLRQRGELAAGAGDSARTGNRRAGCHGGWARAHRAAIADRKFAAGDGEQRRRNPPSAMGDQSARRARPGTVAALAGHQS